MDTPRFEVRVHGKWVAVKQMQWLTDGTITVRIYGKRDGMDDTYAYGYRTIKNPEIRQVQ